MAERINNMLQVCAVFKTYFVSKDENKLKVKEWKNIVHANSNQKRAEVVILMSDKRKFKSILLQKTKKDIIYG